MTLLGLVVYGYEPPEDPFLWPPPTLFPLNR